MPDCWPPRSPPAATRSRTSHDYTESSANFNPLLTITHTDKGSPPENLTQTSTTLRPRTLAEYILSGPVRKDRVASVADARGFSERTRAVGHPARPVLPPGFA